MLVKVSFLLAFIEVSSLHQLPNPECDLSVSFEETSSLKNCVTIKWFLITFHHHQRDLPHHQRDFLLRTWDKTHIMTSHLKKDHIALNKMCLPNSSPQNSGIHNGKKGERSEGDRETRDTRRTKPSKLTWAKPVWTHRDWSSMHKAWTGIYQVLCV